MLVAFDAETGLIQPGLLAPPLVCVSYANDEGAGLLHHSEAKPWISSLLEGDDLLVGQNVAYDFGVVAARWPDLLPAIFDKYDRDQVTDTLLRQKLIDIGAKDRGYHMREGHGDRRPKGGRVRSYSLAALAKRWLGVQLDKDTWRLRYGTLYNVPVEDWPEGAKAYSIGDAVTTLQIFVAQESQNHYLLDEYRQARAAWWIHLMSAWGLRTDPEFVDALEARLRKLYEETKARLIIGGLVRDNGTRDTKAAARRMVAECTRRKRKIPETDKKRVKLDRDSCDQLGDPLLVDYAEFSGLGTKLSNFVALLRKGTTTPIQPRFNTLLETGRTSTSPNVQNLPRSGGVRECFVPRKGHVYASADYSAFELCTVAQVMILIGFGKPPEHRKIQTRKLADALNAGFDPHLEVARRIVGCSYAEAVARLATGDEEIDRARQTGKVANFGFPGGLGIARFVHFARKSYGVILTEDEARALKRYWITAWPEFTSYFEWVSIQCEDGETPIDQLFSDRRRGGCSFTEAANTMFQGLAADAAKRAGFLIARACYVDEASPLFGGRPVNFIHDEFIVEVRDDERASDAAEELARLMVEGASGFLPDVPPKAEPCLARRWSKKAKPIRDANGRLVPWDLTLA